MDAATYQLFTFPRLNNIDTQFSFKLAALLNILDMKACQKRVDQTFKITSPGTTIILPHLIERELSIVRGKTHAKIQSSLLSMERELGRYGSKWNPWLKKITSIHTSAIKELSRPEKCISQPPPHAEQTQASLRL